jgi:hypothetical protein
MKRTRMVGRGSVRTGRRASPARYGWPLEQIESENDDEHEKDCSMLGARLKAVGRGSVRTGWRASPARYGWPLEQIESENDDEHEKDCSMLRANRYRSRIALYQGSRYQSAPTSTAKGAPGNPGPAGVIQTGVFFSGEKPPAKTSDEKRAWSGSPR